MAAANMLDDSLEEEDPDTLRNYKVQMRIIDQDSHIPLRRSDKIVSVEPWNNHYYRITYLRLVE